MVWNIFYFHPYLAKWSNLINIFQMVWNHQPVTIPWIVWVLFQKYLRSEWRWRKHTKSYGALSGSHGPGRGLLGGPQKRWMFFWFKLTTRYVHMFLLFEMFDIFLGWSNTKIDVSRCLVMVCLLCFFIWSTHSIHVWYIYLHLPTFTYIDPIKINHSCFWVNIQSSHGWALGFPYLRCVFDHFSRLR